MHDLMADTLDTVSGEVQRIQKEARRNGSSKRPRWPMSVLRTPKGWTCPKEIDGKRTDGVMGAKAERSLVFHVVGMPSYQNQRLGKIAHHTLGDGVFGNFVELSAGAACCHAV